MQSDEERSRPREAGPIGDRSTGDRRSDGRSTDARQQPGQEPADRRRPQGSGTQTGAPRYGSPQYGAPQFGSPRYGAQQSGAGRYGAGRFDAGQFDSPERSPRRQPLRSAQPPTAGLAPPHVGTDAPLIHPAAAQAASVLPYGVPVYRTPVSAAPPAPHRGLSITALVLGICSFVFAWTLVVVPIIGIVFGCIALRREPTARVMATIGLIASTFGLLWVLLVYLLPLLGMLMLFAAGPS